MRDLTPVSDDEMVVAFLQGELASPIWEAAIRDGVDGFRLDDLRVITEPNVDDAVEREKRRATLRAPFGNEGTRSLTTNAVGIRRQAERGVDGNCAVDRLGRVVGAG